MSNHFVWSRVAVGLLLLALGACAEFAPEDPVQTRCAGGPIDLFGFVPGCTELLAPGEGATFTVPSGRDLAIRADRELSQGDLIIGLSDGSGLVAFPDLPVAGDRILLPEVGGEITRVHVFRPTGARSPLRVTVAGTSPGDPDRSQSTRLRLGGSAHKVLTGDGEIEYHYLPGEIAREVTVQGPSRVAVHARALYRESDAWVRTYRIGATLDGRPLGTLEFEGAPDLTARLAGENDKLSIGSRQTQYLEVPRGQHRLALTASEPLLAYVRAGAPVRGTQARSVWHPLAPGEQVGVCTDPQETETAARRVARNNSIAGGGLLASAALADAARHPRADPEIAAIAGRLRSAYTFFRDLAPLRPAGLPLAPAYVIAEAQGDPTDAALAEAAGGLSTPVLLDRLVRASFTPLPDAKRPLAYAVPPREAGSDLRLFVKRGALEEPVDLFLAFDDGEPLRLRLLPRAEATGSVLTGTAASLGLDRLAEDLGTTPAQVPATSAFSIYMPPAPVVQSASIRLPLPTGVRAVRLWSSTATGASAALQYRAASAPQLSEIAYRGEVARLGRADARTLFQQALQAALGCASWLSNPDTCPFVRQMRASGSIPAEELYNDLIPMLRLLRARERTLFGSLPQEQRVGPNTSAPKAGAVVDLASAAERTAREDPGQAALEAWSELSRTAAGDLWTKAQLGQAEALEALGESFLAEQILKNAYLEAPTAPGRIRVYDALEKFYRKIGSPAERVGLHAAELARRSDPEVVRDLAGSLQDEGEHALAARIVALLPPGDPGPLIVSLHSAGWIAELRARLPALPADERALWATIIAGRTGEGSAAAATSTLIELAGAEYELPSEPSILRSAGAVPYRATARDAYGRFFIARPGEPVIATVQGPVKVEISARPIHKGGGEPLDGWFTVSGGRREVSVPVSGNYPARGIKAFGLDGDVGTAVTEEIVLPAGLHSVMVDPERFGMLVEFDIKVGQVRDEVAAPPPAQRMAELLRRYENGQSEDLLAEAARLAERHTGERGIAAVWNRFERQSTWQRIESVDASAGSRTLEVPTAAVESSAMAARLALVEPLQGGERLIPSTGETAVSLVNPEPTKIAARLRLDSVPTFPRSPVLVRYRVGNAAAEDVRLTPEDPNAELTISVPRGEHVVRFSVAERQPNQLVRLDLEEEDGTAIGSTRERRYEVATSEEPVVLTVEGPAWLRIDEHKDGDTRRRVRFVEEGLQTITLTPEIGKEQALFRLFRLVPAPEPSEPPPPLSAEAEEVPTARLSRGLFICPAG